MTFQEYDTKIREIISKPDTAMADILPVLDSLKVDLEGLNSVTEENAALKNRVRDLQDANARLFLGATSKPADEGANDDDDELEGVDALNDFVNKLNKED